MTAPVSPDALPPVSVIIPSRGRPVLLRNAVRAALAQTYPAQLEVVVVFDQVEFDLLDDVDVPGLRTLRVVPNTRTPGPAGARNTGILASEGELVAFCDDDDEWLPEKIEKQRAAWALEPDASMVATGIQLETDCGSYIWLPPKRAYFDDLLRSRITEIHPSSFLLCRGSITGPIGLVDEELPAAYGEDYDLLLRASRIGHVLSVVEPLVVVNWNRPSFFSSGWEGIAAMPVVPPAEIPRVLQHPRRNRPDRRSNRLRPRCARTEPKRAALGAGRHPERLPSAARLRRVRGGRAPGTARDAGEPGEPDGPWFLRVGPTRVWAPSFRRTPTPCARLAASSPSWDAAARRMPPAAARDCSGGASGWRAPA